MLFISGTFVLHKHSPICIFENSFNNLFIGARLSNNDSWARQKHFAQKHFAFVAACLMDLGSA